MPSAGRASVSLAWTASCLSALMICWPAVAIAERLPIKRYTMQDGLEHDRIKCIVQDSRGFLWICTARGLSRFDGARFVGYTVEDGLPSPSINDLLERRDGSYWVATNGGGIARMAYEASQAGGDSKVIRKARFAVYSMGELRRANRVNTLHEDGSGQVWAGTDAGLFVLASAGAGDSFRRVALGLEGQADTSLQIWDFAEDSHGNLWIGTSWGVVRRTPDGRTEHLRVRPAQGSDSVRGLAVDGRGRIWAAHTHGVVVFSDTSPAGTVVRDSRWMRPVSGLPDGPVAAVCVTPIGEVWIGSSGGLAEISGAAGTAYGPAHGLGDATLTALTNDRDGNLWVGTLSAGIMKISRSGFTSYGVEDGLGHSQVSAVLESPGGELYFATGGNLIHRFDGRRFVAVRPNLPPHVVSTGRRTVALLDHLGEFWFPSGEALYRFPAVKRLENLSVIAPKAVYTTADGLADNDIFQLFEDSRGDIWIGGWAPDRDVLTKWDRQTGTFRRYSPAEGLPPFSAPICFAEDRFGTVWIGFREGMLLRYRHGRFERVQLPWPTGVAVSELYFDRSGRLWVMSGGGVARVDQPNADSPHFDTYSDGDGLTFRSANAIAEDAWGRMYFGSVYGVDRLDVVSGRVTHYTTADGLTGRDMVFARRDRNGVLWFAMYEGLARLIPDPPRDIGPPSIFIAEVRVSGTSVAADDLGVPEISGLTFEPGENQVQIEYFGLGATLDEAMRYEHLLEGADSGWSAPTHERFVSYPRLAPGRYRFLVRAIASGVPGTTTASVAFSVLPPFWQRGWFVALNLVLMGAAVYGLSRYRLTRQLELERIRTRIATDLHDDVGSSLSQIAILSEVARQRGGREAGIDEPLAKISASSRELVDTMSDIVWAISPNRDSLRDLTYRMRRFASDTFTAANIEFRFNAVGTEEATKIGADVRRDVYLMFKESVNNVVRHARCETASVDFREDEGWLILTVSDDGIGFDHAAGTQGYGLTSLRQRAHRLRGSLEIQSSPDQGTTVTFRIPLHRRAAGRGAPTCSGGDALSSQP